MFLEKIKGPGDLKTLSLNELKQLNGEIRQELIQTVSKHGGHLASNLGIVELTVGIHRVFSSPDDAVIFDVGHQSYVHKLLTGRAEEFDSIRQENGLSGFMNPSESEHDPFITGHSSNAISVACGIAEANRLSGNSNYAVAVVGDGALTGGMTFEALNNSGQGRNKIIVVLNDNKMSISKNVGSLAHHLTRMRIGKRYIRFKNKVRRGLNVLPLIGKPIESFLEKSKLTLKNALYNSNYFENLGYYYMGPIDGNKIEDVLRALEAAKSITRPVLIHACTVKGKGFAFAEKSPTSYHGVSSFDYETGLNQPGDNFSSCFGKSLVRLAQNDDKICAVTAAMTEGTGLEQFRAMFKNRFYDVGIAEQHAVTYCSALASKGYKPVFAVYSSFLQRGYDQIVHDTAIMNNNVTFCVDRAGIVGEDGVTHQGVFDVPFLNTVPNLNVYAPGFYDELDAMLSAALNNIGADVIRYPRGKEPVKPEWYSYNEKEYAIRHVNHDLIAVTYGRLFGNVASACDEINATVCKINKIKPLSDKLIDELTDYKRIVFFEEGNFSGSIAQAVGCSLLKRGYKGVYKTVTVDDGFVPHMPVDSAFKRYGFDRDSIISKLVGERNEQ